MLPATVRVRVMSDDAGYVDTTRVGHSEIPFAQLLDMMVAVSGLDPARICTMLRAGAATLRSHRYRWESIAATEAEIAPLLERFPKPDPSRAFDASRCLLARIRAGIETIELPRDVAARSRRAQRQNFWDVLMGTATARGPQYDSYSYRDGSDLYTLDLTREDETRLRQAAPLLTVDRTAEQVTGLPLERLTLYVKR